MDIWGILTVIMAVVTAISLILAYFAYFKPRKRQKLLYQSAAIQYFEENDYTLPSDVVMTFEGQKVARLAKAVLILWNGGTDVLRGEDIVQHDPIRIRLPTTGRILSSTIVGATNETNRVLAEVLSQTQNEVLVTYDYLNPNDGVVIQVLHDAKQRHPIVVGEAKGLSERPRGLGTVNLYDLEVPRKRRRRRILMRVMFSAGLVFLVLGILRAVVLLLDDQEWISYDVIWLFTDERSFSEAVFIMVFGLVYLAMPFYEFLTNRGRYPKSLGRFLLLQDGESPSSEPKTSWSVWKRRDRGAA